LEDLRIDDENMSVFDGKQQDVVPIYAIGSD
jgi:hypothetical protein